jgi:hypothetical protein
MGSIPRSGGEGEESGRKLVDYAHEGRTVGIITAISHCADILLIVLK